MIISFRHTVNALLKGQKTVTRRMWADRTARCYKVRTWHDAWSALPWIAGAQRVGIIEATQDAYREALGDITLAEVVAEGFPQMSVEDFLAMYCRIFKAQPETILWVARFRLVERCVGRRQQEGGEHEQASV